MWLRPVVSEAWRAIGYVDYAGVFETVAFEGFLHGTVVFMGVSAQGR